MSSKIPIATLIQELDPQRFIARSKKKFVVKNLHKQSRTLDALKQKKQNYYKAMSLKNGRIISQNAVNKPFSQFELIKQQLQAENLPITLDSSYDLLSDNNVSSSYRSRQRQHYRYLSALLNRL